MSASMPVLKMLFGYMLLIVLASLAAAIALGDVEQNTSHGLDQILGGLLVITGAFAHWAFGESEEKQSQSLPTTRSVDGAEAQK